MHPDDRASRGRAGPAGSGTDAGAAATPGDRQSLWRFALMALTAVSIASAAFLLWHLRDAIMMAFGAVVIAVLLVALAEQLRRPLALPHRWAVAMAAVLVLAVIVGFAWLMGAQVRSSFAQMWEALPLGIGEIERRLGISIFGDGQGGIAGGAGGAGGDAADGLSRLWGWVSSYGYPVVNAVFGIIVVVIAGVFVAMQPELYRRGTVKLFPPSQHARIDETLGLMGRSLRFWLIGQLIAMAIVGVLVGLGAWAIGLPAPIALGLFAALTEFVPIVGPIVGAAPAVLLALNEGGATVLWTVLLYVAIQQVESNMIAPVVQEKMVRLPPAIFLLAVLVSGGIFGVLGVIFAAPLAVVAYVAVQKLWVRDTLHEPVAVSGERGAQRG